MTPERWIEVVIMSLALLGGIVVWAFNVESRLRVLERIFAQHVEDKTQALRELKTDMHEIKTTLEQLKNRCIAFRHFERATYAGQDVDAEP